MKEYTKENSSQNIVCMLISKGASYRFINRLNALKDRAISKLLNALFIVLIFNIFFDSINDNNMLANCFLRLGKKSKFLNEFTELYQNLEFKGVTFVGDKYCPFVNFSDPLAHKSIEKLAETGANWVAIVVTEYQDYLNSTNIYPLYDNFIKNEYFIYKTETMIGLQNIIEKAKSLNLKVMLKPHIDLSREIFYNVTWRGNIGEKFNTEAEWEAWFASYENFILKYAKLAEKLNVEMFSISCELIATSRKDEYWSKIIQKVRKVYSGLLTDSANHDGEEYNKTWWNELDYIGVDAYYLPMKNQDLEFSKDNFDEILETAINKLKELSEKFKKEVIITEVGFCSGNCRRDEKVILKDHYIQAYFYEKFIKAFAKENFIKGFFWWAWNSDPYFGGLDDMCISPQNKISEYILRKYYGGDTRKVNYKSDERAVCPCTI